MRADRGLIAAWSGSRVNFTSRRRSHFFELNGRIPSRARQNQFSLIQNNEAPRGGHAPRGEVRAIQAARRQREVAMTDKKTPDDINPIPRRSFLVGAGTAVAASLTPAEPAQAQQAKPAAAPAAASEPEAYLTLTAPEAAFLSAAVDAFIPADELTPSGSECGVVTFIDRQLASAWGGGAKMYRQGPFRKAKAEYGYQLPLTPRQFFEAGIVAVNAWTRKVHGKDFDRLPAKERDGDAAANHHGVLLRRPDLRRQPQQGVVEDGRFPGPAGGLRQPDRGVPHQALRRRTAVDRRFFVRGGGHGNAIEGSRCGHGRHGLDRQHHGARIDQGRAERRRT